MTQFQENTLIGQTKGWKDGQTLFYRAPPAPVGGSNKYTYKLSI